ncbi:MAG TPA: sensor histidine kinase [Bryobacteraceae bacterium]|nr:sensor histidine kinase [Bryobacteraceae bacterium]
MFRRQTKSLLWAGFGGLLLLMGVSGVSAISFLRQIQVRQDSIRRGFVDRNRLLESLRSDLYLSGTYVRDFLLDKDGNATQDRLEPYFQTERRILRTVQQYQKLLRPEEIASFTGFRGDLDGYLRMLNSVAGWTPPQRLRDGNAFVERELLPRRMEMVDFAGQIERTNEKRLEAGSQETSDLFRQFRIRLSVLVVLTLAVGLVLAGASLWRILQLEKESEMRFSEIVRAKQELQELSARVLETQESERRRIARELHDEVGQSLWAVTLGIGNLSGALKEGNQPEALRQIDLIRSIAEGSVRAVRNMSLLLRPSMLDDLGLQPALKWLGREVSRTTDLRVEIAADDVPDELPEEHKTCVYRVAQEALHNCSRHAGARSARVHLHADRARLFLSVQDDGSGFDAKREKGLGLLGMEERVSHLGGRFRVDSAPGRGTTLSLELPLPARG